MKAEFFRLEKDCQTGDPVAESPVGVHARAVICSFFLGNKCRYFNPHNDIFLTLTYWMLCLNIPKP